MDLRHLRYFVAIAEERSFTRAAERLWIAQPGLSTQIRRLEDELGVQLFERHTRGVDLTDAGELFLERARVTIAAAEAARATGHDLRAGLVGRIRLGLAAGTAWQRAPDLLAGFERDRPDIELTVVESYGGTLLRDLRDSRLDAVLVPSIFGAVDLFALRVDRVPWVVLAGESHRLGATDGPVSADELRAERFVVTGHRDGAAYDRAVAETLAGLGITAELQRGGSGPALFSSVAAGEALALTTSGSGGPGIIARRLDPTHTVDFALLWRDETPSPALDGFIEAARALAASAAEPRLGRRLARIA